MGERKVICHYFSPDFDPRSVTRPSKKSKATKSTEQNVRAMLPFSVRCSTCGTYNGAGLKRNTMKETVQGEDYLGIEIIRLKMKCVYCAAPFSLKTDPASATYVCEQGVTPGRVPWTVESKEEAEEVEKVQDPMAAMETAAAGNRIELEDGERLQRLVSRNRAREGIDIERTAERWRQEDEERQIAAAFVGRKAETGAAQCVRRLEEPDQFERPSRPTAAAATTTAAAAPRSSAIPRFTVRAKAEK